MIENSCGSHVNREQVGALIDVTEGERLGFGVECCHLGTIWIHLTWGMLLDIGIDLIALFPQEKCQGSTGSHLQTYELRGQNYLQPPAVIRSSFVRVVI
jgi:hypothetical protein